MAQRNQVSGVRPGLCSLPAVQDRDRDWDWSWVEPCWPGPNYSAALTILCILEARSQAVLFIQTGVLFLLFTLCSPICRPLDGPLPWGALGRSRTARHCAQPTAGAPTASILCSGPPGLQARGSRWGQWGLQVGHTQHALDGLLSAGRGRGLAARNRWEM